MSMLHRLILRVFEVVVGFVVMDAVALLSSRPYPPSPHLFGQLVRLFPCGLKSSLH